MGAHPSGDAFAVLPGPLALAPVSAPFREETAPLLPSDPPLRELWAQTGVGLSCNRGPWGHCCGHFLGIWRAQWRSHRTPGCGEVTGNEACGPGQAGNLPWVGPWSRLSLPSRLSAWAGALQRECRCVWYARPPYACGSWFLDCHGPFPTSQGAARTQVSCLMSSVCTWTRFPETDLRHSHSSAPRLWVR